MNLRRLALSAAGTSAVILASILPVDSASAAAFVQHPEPGACSFEPGDVPGVDVYFPAACTIVTSGSGSTTIVARGHLPDGYSLTKTFVGTLPCFGEIGKVVATVSGQVTATCHFKP